MLNQVVNVRPLSGSRLRLVFDDGLEGIVDVGDLTDFEGVFAGLRDEAEFHQVRVDRELGTIVWPSGADLDPDVLHAIVEKQRLR